jgi:hypothetical protein
LQGDEVMPVGKTRETRKHNINQYKKNGRPHGTQIATKQILTREEWNNHIYETESDLRITMMEEFDKNGYSNETHYGSDGRNHFTDEPEDHPPDYYFEVENNCLILHLNKNAFHWIENVK